MDRLHLRKGIEYSRNLMTVRIAKILGIDKILDLSKKLNIYDEIPELLSVSLGAAETTLIKFNICLRTICKWREKN